MQQPPRNQRAHKTQPRPGEEDRAKREFDGNPKIIWRHQQDRRQHREQQRGRKCSRLARPRRQVRPYGPQRLRRALCQRPRAMPCNELLHALGGRNADAIGEFVTGFPQCDQRARGKQPRRHDEFELAGTIERQNPDGGGFDQPFIRQRTGVARDSFERLEPHIERGTERREIGFLADDVGRNQCTVGADPDLRGPQLGRRDDAGRQQIADTIEFGADREHPRRRRWRTAPMGRKPAVDERRSPRTLASGPRRVDKSVRHRHCPGYSDLLESRPPLRFVTGNRL